MEGPFLYRALRPEEINAGYVLIPKSQEPFQAEARLGIDTRLPFQIGLTAGHAVNQHQWKQNGFPTRGISTTPHIERAKFYAQTNKVVVKIERGQFEKYKIREYAVKEWVVSPLDIAVPEDDEIILVQDTDGIFPKEIICEVILIE
ncbi:MAG TPA: hypothetical protein VJ044_00480 [Candidatus Hodarchaeales archaeon]|nr:hypothetical protein [Candidatus Hodarchaeales archaeon]